MSVASSEEVCETESVYSVNVKDLGNIAFKVRICLGEKLIASEPTEVITIEISDLLTKSLYQAYFDLDDVGRMGSFVELEQVFVILQACLSARQEGTDSTSHRIEFGYIDTSQSADEKKDQVMFDRKSMARARKALKREYHKLEKDSSAGDSLILAVQFSSEIFTEFFAFPVPIMNKDDETGRLMQMMKDRKLEIEEIRAERDSLKNEFEKVKAEKRDLAERVAALEARMDECEEGIDKNDNVLNYQPGVEEKMEAHDEAGAYRCLKMAKYFPTTDTVNGAFIAWNSAVFDLLGAQFVQRTNSNQRITIKKAGYYRITACTRMLCSNSGYLALYHQSSAKFYSYTCTTNGYKHVSMNETMKLNANEFLEFYVSHNGTCNGGVAFTSLEIEFLETA